MKIIPFIEKLREHRINLQRERVSTLQINIGRRCNLACRHCHVESSPHRTENMEEETARRLAHLIRESKIIETVDFTGGAPELNPHFRDLVRVSRESGKKMIARCNITVLFEKGQEDTPTFYQKNGVHVIASLPCYSKENVEKQRGRGVFDKSTEGLKILNGLGYGKKDSGLILDLVYNPLGPSLPPSQEQLQEDYKKELRELFEIEFNNLFTITNMPIKRFLDDLIKRGKYESYMELLANNFNPHAALGVMCRDLISVSCNGELFDCDFNQMLEIPLGNMRKTIWEIESLDDVIQTSPIAVKDHCYGCTAGCGSSCVGAISK